MNIFGDIERHSSNNIVFISQVPHIITSTFLCLHLLVHRSIGHKYTWEYEET